MDSKYEFLNDHYVLSATQGKKMIDQIDNIILLDVRTQQEYIEKHIPSAKLLPIDDFMVQVQSLYPNKDSIYILYCRSGVRSEYARRIMKHLGYHHVYDMGGIIDWPYDTITG